MDDLYEYFCLRNFMYSLGSEISFHPHHRRSARVPTGFNPEWWSITRAILIASSTLVNFRNLWLKVWHWKFLLLLLKMDFKFIVKRMLVVSEVQSVGFPPKCQRINPLPTYSSLYNPFSPGWYDCGDLIIKIFFINCLKFSGYFGPT